MGKKLAMAFGLSFISTVLQANERVNFAGFNAGGGIGGGISYTKVDRQYLNGSNGYDSFDFSNSGVLGDIILGYGWVVPQQYYVGLQVNFGLSSVKGEAQNYPANITSFKLQTKMKYMSSIYAQFGKIIHNVMPYIKAGAAFAKWEANCETGASDVPDVNTSKTLTAWSLGTGVDFLVTEHITLGADYTYSQFNNLSLQQPKAVNYKIKPHLNTFKFTVKWYF